MNELSLALEELLEDIHINVVDIADFNERVVGAYNSGTAEKGLEADDQVARSIIPAGTGALRDFSYIAPDIPEFITENCVGCMECVTQCPDTAILGKVAEPATLDEHLAKSPMRPCARAWPISGPSPQVLSPFSRRKASAAASSASSSIPPNARAARNAWTPAAIMMR